MYLFFKQTLPAYGASFGRLPALLNSWGDLASRLQSSGKAYIRKRVLALASVSLAKHHFRWSAAALLAVLGAAALYTTHSSKNDYSSLADRPSAPLVVGAGDEDTLSGSETYQRVPGTPGGPTATVPAEIYGPTRPESGADPAALPVPPSPSESYSKKKTEPADSNTLSKEDLECLAGGECASSPVYSKEKVHDGKKQVQAAPKIRPAHSSGKKPSLTRKFPSYGQPGSGSDFVMPSVETPPLVPINNEQE